MMRRFLAFMLALVFLVPEIGFTASEIRPLGGPGANNSGDLLFGPGYWDSPGNRRVYRINANMIPFLQDNAIKLGNANLYGLSAGVAQHWGIPYFDASGNLNWLGMGLSGYCLKFTGAGSAPVVGNCGGLGDNSSVLNNSYLGWGTGGIIRSRYNSTNGRFELYPESQGSYSFAMDNTGDLYINSWQTNFLNYVFFRNEVDFDNTTNLGFGRTGAYPYSPSRPGGIYLQMYNQVTKQLYFNTRLTGSTMTSTNPAYLFNFSDNGVAASGQRVWGVSVNGVLKFYVDEAGNVTATGSITAPQFISNTPNGYRGYNPMDTGGYLGTVTKGLSFYDGDSLVNKTYDGAGFRNQQVFVPVPANENAACMQGMVSADNVWQYVCYAANKWKTVRFDNVWKATTGGGGGTSDNTTAGNVTHVQSAGYNSSGGTSSSVALPFLSNNASGNLIVVTARGSSASISGVTDTRGNSYTKGPSLTDNMFAMYYAQNVGAGANTVTVTYTGTVNWPRVSIHEYSGAKTSGAYDSGAAGTYRVGVASANGNYTDNVTTTASGDLVIGAFTDFDSGWSGSAAAGTGFTARYDSGSDYLVEGMTQPSAGSVRATMTPPNTDNYDWLIGTFKKL